MSDEEKPVKVRMDFFMVDVFPVEIDLTEEALGQMVAYAESFLRSGGVMPWDRWSLLSEASRMAFLKASENVRVGV